MKLWVEVRAFQERVGAPFFVELEKWGEVQYLGFRSVYAYPDEVKVLIEERRSTAGLDGQPVYSDTLFLDFDNVEPTETLLWLYDEGIAHSVWTSGNRSVHIHIPIEPMYGEHVPYSQRVWVAREIPIADVSFYTHAGQYRLPGTRHQKTGRKKELKHQLYGKRLEIPRTDKPIHQPVKGDGDGKFMAHLFRQKSEGGRRVYAWHLAQQAKQEGLSYEAALKGILWWNSRHALPPLPEHVVRDRVLGVYTD